MVKSFCLAEGVRALLGFLMLKIWEGHGEYMVELYHCGVSDCKLHWDFICWRPGTGSIIIWCVVDGVAGWWSDFAAEQDYCICLSGSGRCQGVDNICGPSGVQLLSLNRCTDTRNTQ